MLISEEALYKSDLYNHYLDTVVDGGFISSLEDILNTHIDLYATENGEHTYEFAKDLPEETILSGIKPLREHYYPEISYRLEDGRLCVKYNINYLTNKNYGKTENRIEDIGIL